MNTRGIFSALAFIGYLVATAAVDAEILKAMGDINWTAHICWVCGCVFGFASNNN